MKIASSNVGMESARSYNAASISYRRFEITDFSDALSSGTSGSDGKGGTASSLLGAGASLNASASSGTGTSLNASASSGTGTSLNASRLWNALARSASLASDELSAASGDDHFGSLTATTDEIGDLQQQMSGIKTNYALRSDEETSAETIRQETIRYLFDLLFGNMKQSLADWVKENITPTIGSTTGIGEMMQTPIATYNYQAVDYYEENEETSFSTQGTVVTADGREISFNVDLTMSREFSQKYARDLSISFTQVCDPLVINLDGNVASVSDQKIRFDIDGDGELDTVNRLSSGSGYLALDKNGDGTINDGNELFGASNGDGFAALAEYDEDGNGWIDESDSVWKKLKIWCTDEDGTEHLYSLEDSGVGALCLQKVATNFSDTDEANNAKAYIRSTGIFLYENGSAGTLQHLDLVKYSQEA